MIVQDEITIDAPIEPSGPCTATSSAGRRGPLRSPRSSCSTGRRSASATAPGSSSPASRRSCGRSPRSRPGTSWTWTTRSPGATTVATHLLERLDDGRTRVTQTIDQRGVLGVLVGVLTRRLTRRYLAMEGAGLRQRVEAGVPAALTLGRRDELLAAVVADCAEHGLGNRSLRDIADHVGTSHRMLIHHFGSREELLVAVVQEVEARQAALAGDARRPPGRPARRDVGAPQRRRRCGPSSACSSSATPAAPTARRRSTDWSRPPSSRGSGRRRRRPGAAPASASPSCGACCSTSWRPATRRRPTAAIARFADLVGRRAGA